ncbi:MAG: glycosyltransferase family 39 protein [Kiritimatiellaeota bacterium]|nr:glycosyltransferase family 39 protein [Kiritimatiellota bacterium]
MDVNSSLNQDFRLFAPLAVSAGLALFFVMSHGCGVSTDSVVFLDAAENILRHGKIYVTAYGMNAPMTHFPPLYPIVLAGIGALLNCSVEMSARIAGAAAYGVNIYLACVILKKIGASRKTAVFAALLLALSEYMILIHSQVFTEPLFITFTLAAFIFISDFLKHGKIRFLLLSAACVGFACLTRYAGLALIAFAGLAILLSKLNFRKKIARIALFCSVALFPLGLWCVRNALLAGTTTDRSIVFHPAGVAHIRQLLRSILFVFLPNPVLGLLKSVNSAVIAVIAAAALAGILIMTVILIAMLRHLKTRSLPAFSVIWTETNSMLKVLLLFLLVYPAFLLFSISFADYTTPLSYRIMLPEFVSALLFCWGAGALFAKNSVKPRIVFKVIAAILLATYAVRAYSLCSEIYSNGLGYSSVAWRNSKLIDYVKSLPRDSRIFTNGGAGIYYTTKRGTLPLARKWINGKPNSDYAARIEEMRKVLSEKDACVVYFKNIPSSLLPTTKELLDNFDLKIVIDSSNGTVMKKP